MKPLQASVLAVLFAAGLPAQNKPTWDAKAAAGYLDGRAEWWMGWSSAQRDHETFCISCHTALPYALGRPALRAALGERDFSAPEHKLIDNVVKRVRMWNDVQPFYADSAKSPGKTAESRGTEAILNALILTSNGQKEDARLALDNMWAEQLKTGDDAGSFPWLQFHNAPWEGDSQFYGATLAAVAFGMAPADYRATPIMKERVELLRAYLVRQRGPQKLIDRMILLWASTRIPELLTPAERKEIVDEALTKQQTDGGFSLSNFVGSWKRKDNTPLDANSDGYATGVVAFVLQQNGMKRDDPAMKRSLGWLAANQDKSEGRWPATSLNKQRALESDAGRFMSDAATAYAAMALETPR